MMTKMLTNDACPVSVPTRNASRAPGTRAQYGALSARVTACEPLVRVIGRREPEHVERGTHGVSAADLLARVDRRSLLDADDLEAWLLAERLAERDGGPGLLVATVRALELAAALD
jgi:hypothetical protein